MNWEYFNTNYQPYKNFFAKITTGLPAFLCNAGSIQMGLLSSGFFLYKLVQNYLATGQSLYNNMMVDYFLGGFSILLWIVVICLNKKAKISTTDEDLESIMSKR